MVHVDFLADADLDLDPHSELPETDIACLTWHVRERGISGFNYTFEEHARLRCLAQEASLRIELIQSFDRTYNFIYWMTRKVRTGVLNSISGMCYDIALKNYAKIAQIIEKSSL